MKKQIKSLASKLGIIKVMPTENSDLYSSYKPFSKLTILSSEELLSLMKHEAHRIEKSIYNGIFEDKKNIYIEKFNRIKNIVSILEERKELISDPSYLWAKDIFLTFNDLENGFIEPRSLNAKSFDMERLNVSSEILNSRRSTRVWSKCQLEKNEFEKISNILINCGIHAPCSGNRQPWKFLPMIDQKEKMLLKGLKEEHCTSAPLLIFVGMDKRVYGSLSGKYDESAMYLDAGACIMAMISAANDAGLGTCWNHFAKDMIFARKSNIQRYSEFSNYMKIPDYIEPMAILAIGIPEFLPPVPVRLSVENVKIK
ncbi:hypothetical protein BOO35_18865 [Vibrio navarrensis]|uniref:nitroreductase family protein n=1 Tax=Vibrio navarrensis TaxID=29495 RepID=UPI0018685961|nr:nitroreductase family protein [Vibrio navarrensis]MBE3667131.1 hypothetical protein [Vibrio navarrensis]